MKKSKFDIDVDNAWCPGCGNFNILESLKLALEEINIDPSNLCLVSGIGQAAKLPQYMKTNYFNGLHGRALPVATAIKLTNPELKVIVHSGDGDCFGEGGNHLLHTIRKNPDITLIVHNNMVYGLTKGQGSPMSQLGFKNPVQVDGVYVPPFNAMATALSIDVSFASRAFSGDVEKTKNLLVKAINHKGFSLVEILQPCISFNKMNTFMWFKKNTYYLEDTYNPQDKFEAFKKVNEKGKLPLGVIFSNPNREVIEEQISTYKENKNPLYMRRPDLNHLQNLLDK